MKIAITNIVALNGGDAAIVMGMIKTLKFKYGEDIEIVCFASHPDVCTTIYPNLRWMETLGLSVSKTPFNHIRYFGKIIRFLKTQKYFLITKLLSNFHIDLTFFISQKTAKVIKEYINSDIIISTGGTYLIEPYGMKSQIIDYKASLYLKKDLWFYTQSMGPFYNNSNIKALRKIFSKSKLILCRDEQTKKNILAINPFPIPDIKIEPDAAFALCDTHKLKMRNSDFIGKHKKVGFSVREWKHFSSSKTDSLNKYKKSIAASVIHFINKGFKVYFFSTCQGLKYYTNDAIIANEIKALIPQKYHKEIIIFEKFMNISEIIGYISKMDILVATRLHMCILSLISGTPVYPIAYEFKTIELFKSLNYKKVLYMDELNEITLTNDLDIFIKSYSSDFRKQINDFIAKKAKRTLEVLN